MAVVCSTVAGSHIGDAYSSTGLASVLKHVACVWIEHPLMLRKANAADLFAFDTVDVMFCHSFLSFLSKEIDLTTA